MAVILIVEDEFFIRGIAEVMIRGWGHQTLSATDRYKAPGPTP
jgi:CheY-like chemotaxis protein